jgi:hypothetical protein
MYLLIVHYVGGTYLLESTKFPRLIGTIFRNLNSTYILCYLQTNTEVKAFKALAEYLFAVNFQSFVKFLWQRRMKLCLNVEVERAMTSIWCLASLSFLPQKRVCTGFFMHSGDNKRFCEYAQF